MKTSWGMYGAMRQTERDQFHRLHSSYERILGRPLTEDQKRYLCECILAGQPPVRTRVEALGAQ